MYLGLDLRGGVHFLLQVDMQAAITKRLESLGGDLRSQLRERNVRHGGITREGQTLRVRFRDAATRDKAREVIVSNLPDLNVAEREDGQDLLLVATLKPEAIKRTQEYALKQNITTLHNRIKRAGRRRAGDPAAGRRPRRGAAAGRAGHGESQGHPRAHREPRDTHGGRGKDESETLAAAAKGQVPFGDEYYVERNGQPLLVKKQVVLTGDRLTDAQPGFDSQTNEPAVHLRLDGQGARIFQEVTRESVGKRMAILLIEKGKGEVITAPVIRSEIPGGRVQISGRMSTTEAADVALLLRAGALAAPMEIIEERTVGPSLGKDNIEKGFNATRWGFVAIVVFMSAYYVLFGLISSVALGVNLLFLVALLSLLQATLTLPGIAAIALTLGMAIDANVLINERIREELRGGATPRPP